MHVPLGKLKTERWVPEAAGRSVWAEMNLIVSDQFRAGNVPAQQEPLAAARRAFGSLPESVTEFYFRGDSACYEKNLIGWLRNEQRRAGRTGR